MWPGELGDVQRVLIPIDHQRDVGDVAIIQSVAGDAAFRGPAAEVAGAVAQSVGKFLDLALGTSLQAAERGSDLNWRPAPSPFGRGLG